VIEVNRNFLSYSKRVAPLLVVAEARFETFETAKVGRPRGGTIPFGACWALGISLGLGQSLAPDDWPATSRSNDRMGCHGLRHQSPRLPELVVCD